MLLSSLAVFGGFVLLVWGAERFVHGASATARNLGVSPLIIGLTIVGFGTSAPEMLVSGVAAWEGNPGLGVGNALGSNITNIGLILGLTAIVSPFVVNSDLLRREYPLMFAIMVLALILLVDGDLSRIDGLVLLAGVAVMTFWLIRMSLRKGEPDPMVAEYEQEIPTGMALRTALLWTGVGLLVLLASSRLLVWGAVNIAGALGVSDLVIGLTIVAIGTSLPELAASVTSVLKKEPDIAIGNVIGSNMFNLLAVLGLPGLIHPYVLEPGLLDRDFPVMFGFTIALFAMAYGFRDEGRITRWEGAALVIAYLVYLGILYLTATG